MLPVRYGIVGVGLMGMEHIHNILHLDGAKITCVADNYEESVEKCTSFFKERHPELVEDVETFSSCEELFKSNLCDIAVIATPNHTHYEVLMSAYALADTSMHILVEKPMCTNIEDCRKVIIAAEKRTGKTLVGLEYSYMPPIRRVIDDVKIGIVGPVRMVAIREHRFPFLTKVRNWNRFSCNSGGTFVEKCCHFFDLFNRILEPHTPVSVLASGGQDVNHLYEVYNGKKSDILDNGYVIINYSGGRRACLDLCMFAEASHSQEEVSIIGARGKLEAFLPQLEVRTGIRGENECGKVKVELVDDDRIKYRGHHYGSSYLEHIDILAQVRSSIEGSWASRKGKHETAGLLNGLLSVAMGVAAHKSIEEGRLVYMTELVTEQELEDFHSNKDSPQAIQLISERVELPWVTVPSLTV